MGTCVCACGAKYRFAGTSAGRQAPCKRCGATLTLQDWVEPPGGIPTPIIEVSEDVEILPTGLGPERGYGRAILWSFLFPASVHNLAAFLTLWIVFGVLEIFIAALGTPSLRLFVFAIVTLCFWLAIHLWWIAFQVAVVEYTAGGQFQLPEVQVTGDILSDLIEPAVRWLGSGFIVFGPMLGCAIFEAFHGRNVIGDTWEALTVPQLVGVPGPIVDPILMTLFVVGLFLWPMVLMVIVFGGFGFLWRVDLLLFSLGNTLGAYLVTVLIVAICVAAWIAAQHFLSPSLSPALRATNPAVLAQAVVTRFLASGIDVYVAIVAARAIGLYFRHYGHRFAWDWGQLDQ